VVAIRAASASDADALMALYRALDDEDRHTRFFSQYRPDEGFVRQVLSSADRGGLELLAIVRDADDAEVLVGEAGYTMRPNGNGELGITVDRRWRGWLGPYLLDALLTEAHARGIPNLEADVLTTNPSMLALVRARGYVTKDVTDWSSVHVVLATRGRTPTWASSDSRPRVLAEVPGGRWHADADARAAGLQVLMCPGPATNPRCPVLAGRPCPLAATADVIVVEPDAADPRWAEIVRAHGQFHPGVPVCVERRPGVSFPIPEGDEAVDADRGTNAVVEIVERLAAHSTSRAET
jgi:RimJ/RimL family protein N-acetyltransferase